MAYSIARYTHNYENVTVKKSWRNALCTSSTFQVWFLISNIAADVLVAAADAMADVVAGKVHQHHHYQSHHLHHGIFVIPLKSNADFLEFEMFVL